MPQMAPMSWLTLFFFFSLSLMIFTILNYPLMSQTCQMMDKTTKSLPTSLTWKW
uniref:ATP synthase F0 subunit 8 n=1 Tax=Anelytra multicurvata TaxID=2966319 RepID=UPI00211F1DEB|nr:ATP synthase F0 subunit 8 [Anelytra multicurvata]UTU96089.1 ATP synthase F0 subunit 8 [Anelytra multicurvata]